MAGENRRKHGDRRRPFRLFLRAFAGLLIAKREQWTPNRDEAVAAGSAGLAEAFDYPRRTDRYRLMRMMRATVEATVRDLLKEIREHRWLNLYVPHGFELEDVTVEQRPNLFAPETLTEWSVIAELSVPVIYAPDSSRIPVRASLPACRHNLDGLRAWISDRAYRDPIGRLGLHAWDVTPDEAPAPYLADGRPAGPPARWSVAATFDVF